MPDSFRELGGTYQICPYTLRPLSELESVTQAHIFPHAIGGGLDFAVLADESSDSQLGRTLDAWLVDSPLVRACRCLLSIRSRSGEATWQLQGTIAGTSTRVSVEFDRSGRMETRVVNPVQSGPGQHARTIICSREERDRFMRELLGKWHSRGNVVQVTGPRSLESSQINIDLEFNAAEIKRGLLKIAFLAAYKFLGDDWLHDPLLPDWHKVLFAENQSELRSSGLCALAFGATDEAEETLEMLFPKLSMGEHGVALVHVPGVGIIVAVILFGNLLFSVVALVSDTHHYRVRELTGRLAVCDATSRNTQVSPWEFGSAGGDPIA